MIIIENIERNIKQRMKEGIDSKSYTEVYEIFNKLGDSFINRIPKEIYLLIEKNRDTQYKPKVFLDDNTINKEGISKETLALFAFLNIAYIADDETKNELLKIYNENEEKIQKEIYNKQKIEKEIKEIKDDNKVENENISNKTEVQSLTVQKESLFKRFINKIKDFFKIKK